ncbi:MAG: OmpA family protein, partial [Pseudomonadota bacterium]
RIEGETFGQAARDALAERLQAAVLDGFQVEQSITVSPGPLAVGGSGALEPAACLTRLSEILSGSEIRFSTGDATIERASFALLDQLAYVARACPQTQLEVGGHTDADGDADANQALSLRRAVSVVNYLIVARVSSARLTAVGYGETMPIASNDTAEGKAQNRRIEFKIIQ